MRSGFRKWLGQCIIGLGPSADAQEVLLSSTIARVLCLDSDPSRYASMGEMHPDSEFVFTDLQWEGAQIHRTLYRKEATVGCLKARILFFVSQLCALLPVYSWAAVFRIVSRYLSSSRSLRRVKCLRGSVKKEKVEAWFVIAANNKRVNAQLIKHITAGLPRTMGILLSGDLRMLVQRDSDLKSVKSDVFLEDSVTY